MANLTGQIIYEKYSSGSRKNSFYQEQRLGTEMADMHMDTDSRDTDIMYYADKNDGHLEMKNTYLLGR